MVSHSSQIAFLFPGQGSQTLGMGQELAKVFPEAKEVFDQANEILGFNLSRLAWDGPQNDLNDTINTQPALLVHSIAALRVLQHQFPDLHAQYLAGHSMGQISALVAAGALTFPLSVELVYTRGKLMKRAGGSSPGGMAAIIGLDIASLEDICDRASSNDEIVQIANDNCPGQVVISGSEKPLSRAMKLAKENGARRVVRLAVSIAAHSPLMESIKHDFCLAVENCPIIDPLIPIIGNVSASPLGTREQIRADLNAQLTSRVRWTESIIFMRNLNITTFIEIGNGKVLSGMLKRIDRNLKGFSFGNPGDLINLPN